MAYEGMGVNFDEANVGYLSDWSDFISVNKADFALIQKSLTFASEYINKQDDFINVMLKVIDGLDVSSQAAGGQTQVWEILKKELAKKYEQLQEDEMEFVKMIHGEVQHDDISEDRDPE